ncbi:hypothetical protein [Gemella sanguinis]|nr:hypothetical protein [Gemella sanguinis]
MQQVGVIWFSFFIYKEYIIKTSKKQHNVAKNKERNLHTLEDNF